MIIFIALLSYLAGPFIYHIFRNKHAMLSIFDGLLFVVMSVFCLNLFAEKIVEVKFMFGALLFLLGIFIPNLLEKTFKEQRKAIHNIFILLAVLAFYCHIYLEMQLLADHEYLSSLDLGILLHRIPVGLLIWWLIFPRFGFKIAMFAILGVLVANLTGVFLPLNLGSFDYLEIFIAGAILHVVLFSFHGLPASNKRNQIEQASEQADTCCAVPTTSEHQSRFEFFGNILGLLIAFSVIYFFDHHSHGHHESATIWREFLELAYLTAPALLIGLVLSVAIKYIFPEKTLGWVNKGNVIEQSIKGTLFGIPLPICSCGILPIYRSLVKRGLAPAAAVSFLVATPEIGLDAILISLPLLGAELTLIRVIMAFFFAFLLSLFISNKISPQKTTKLNTLESPEVLDRHTFFDSLKHQVNEIVPWVLIGLIISAIFNLADIEFIAGISIWLQIIIAAAMGLVVYVCASGVTPVVAALIWAGLSPGAAITFLLVGPASNISTLGVLTELHGKRFSIIFAVASIGLAFALGMFVNILFDQEFFNLNISGEDMHDHLHYSWWEHLALILLTATVAFSVYQKGLKRFLLKLS